MEDNLYQKPAPANRRTVWILAAALFVGCCFFTVCVIFLGSLAFVAKRSSDGATTTAIVAATATGAKKAQIATLTAYVTPTGIPSKFSLTDTFDSNQNGWSVGKINDQFWTGESKVENGAYTWNIQEFKKGFLFYSDFGSSPILADFDVSVDAKIINGTDATCSGIIFRKAQQGWEEGGYAISVCKNRQFFAGYLGKGKWLKTSGWVNSSAIHADWNHIEVDARGSRLIYKINDFIVYQMDDTYRSEGTVALFIEVHQANNDSGGSIFLAGAQNAGWMTLLFDNFNLQGR